jgi:hypothetical protein
MEGKLCKISDYEYKLIVMDEIYASTYSVGHKIYGGHKISVKNCQEIEKQHKNCLSLNEWDVEIVTELYVKHPNSMVYPQLGIQNKLDSNGCLILKKI